MAVVGGRGIVFEGPSAVLRLGYQRAAHLGAWRVDGDALTAEIKDFDGFRITQPGLTLEIQNPDGIPTVRPIADVRVSGGGRLSARLVPKR